MMNFSYTTTLTLKREIENSEITRRKVLLELLSPSQKLRMRYEVTVDRIQANLRLSNIYLKKSEIADAFSQGKGVKNESAKCVFEARKALDYIRQNWLFVDKKVTPKDIEGLFSTYSHPPRIDERELKAVLEFIQVNPEHPIIQAGLAVMLFSEVVPGSAYQMSQIMLVALLFLYKFYFDFRGFLVLEEFIINDIMRFQRLIKKGKQEKNISEFLEYFTQIVSLSAEKALERISKKQQENIRPESFFKLSDRQKEILFFLERPGAKITNRKVQKLFNVSQITASRDLSGLTTLGLVFSVGKGRSVYYTKL